MGSPFEVIIPFREEASRLRALDSVMGHCSVSVRLVKSSIRDPWSKGALVYRGMVESAADFVAVVDADAILGCDMRALFAALYQSDANWLIPHGEVFRLNESDSRLFMEGAFEFDDCRSLSLERPPYIGMPGGGCFLARRCDYLACPIDPRFIGWGQEDESFAMAFSTLFGQAERLSYPLIHLYHEPQPRMSRRVGSMANWRLRNRYAAANGFPAQMKSLVREARDVLDSTTTD